MQAGCIVHRRTGLNYSLMEKTLKSIQTLFRNATCVTVPPRQPSYRAGSALDLALKCKMPVRSFLRLAAVGLTASLLCLAQTSSFGQAAQGIATEMIGIAKWLGIILCIICGLGLMGGGGHGAGMFGKITGLVIGLVFALFATPIVNWIQAL